MKITFITGHLCKERHALLNELALDLGENGAEVTILTGFPSRRISNEVREYYLNHPVEQISKNVVVKRIGSKKGEGKGLFVRMIKYLFLTRKLYKQAKKTPTDVYYIYSSPPFLGWIGAKLSKIAPTVYNAQDLFPDSLIKIKNFSEKNLLIKYLRKREEQVYKKNTKIITISNEMKQTIVNAGCDESKVSVIYNWADVDKLYHVERKDNLLMDELKIDKSKFIVSYAGDIGLFQGWDFIIETAKKLQTLNSDIHFDIIGNGSYKETFEKRIKDENITNISLYPIQPASRLPEIYSIGDLELVSIESGVSKIALPSKTFVIMATGSPILSIVDQTSDVASIIKEENAGYTIGHGDVDALVDLIQNAYKNRDNLAQMGKNARKYAENNFARKLQTKKYYDELKSVIK